VPIARTVIGTSRAARFLEADPLAGRPWLAMEYVAGRTLVACVDEDGVLPVPLVAGLGALLAEGLSAVHAAELLHRDLKPQNVIMGKEALTIIDFGLGAFMDAAKESLSHSGMIIGTVRCMPPEQASRHPKVTPAADVYALGAVLLYAAARHCPYDGAAWEAVAVQVANPDIGPELSGVPQPGPRPAGEGHPADPLPSRTEAPQARQAARRPGLRLRPPATMAPKQGHHPSHRPHGRRLLRAAGPAPLENRANLRLARRLPPTPPPL